MTRTVCAAGGCRFVNEFSNVGRHPAQHRIWEPQPCLFSIRIANRARETSGGRILARTYLAGLVSVESELTKGCHSAVAVEDEVFLGGAPSLRQA